MPLDPRIEKVRKEYGLEASDFWELPQKKGTWVAKHAALETAAAKAGIVFTMPQILEAHGESKCVALCVAAKMGERTEWSIGEASPANNKNSYPYAMAEKRAKDRVILKLIGLHGLAYSEDEVDDFKPQGSATAAPKPQPTQDEIDPDGQTKAWRDRQIAAMQKCGTLPPLYGWLAQVAGDGGTITDPDSGSPLDRLKRKSPEIYGDITRAFQEQLKVINRKAA